MFFSFFLGKFLPLGNTKKIGCVKAQKDSFGKTCSMSSHFEGKNFQIGIFEHYIVQGAASTYVN
jgi:hypothetical protein